MKKIAVRSTALALLLVMLCGIANASGILPRADGLFASASAYLYSDLWVTVSAYCYAPHATLRIVSVWSELKNSDGSYTYLDGLPNATYSVHDTTSIGKEYDCSSILTTGTCRVGVRLMCDGVYIIRYSNDLTIR